MRAVNFNVIDQAVNGLRATVKRMMHNKPGIARLQTTQYDGDVALGLLNQIEDALRREGINREDMPG